MNTQDITDAFNNLRTVAGTFRDALDQMGRILEAAVHDLKDRDEAIRVQQERITGLEEDNRRLQERLAQTENDLWAARREARMAKDEAETVNTQLAVTAKQLAEAKTEGVKLREIILNVATSVDSIINPQAKAPEVAPVNPTYSIPAAAATAGKEDTSSGSSTEAQKGEDQPARSYGAYGDREDYRF